MNCKDCDFFEKTNVSVIIYHRCIHKDVEITYKDGGKNSRLMSYQDAETNPEWCPLKNKKG